MSVRGSAVHAGLADGGGQVHGRYFLAAGKDHEAFGQVSELPNVSRPVVVHEIRVDRLVDSGRTVMGIARELPDKCGEKEWDVILPFPERRHFDGDDIQAVV